MCGSAARWKELPIARAATWWLRCDRHRSDRAVRLEADEPFSVVRVDLRVAICAPPGDRRAAADEAVRRVVSALEEVGATATGVKIAGGRAAPAASQAALGRLQLAGPAEGQADRVRKSWGNPRSQDRDYWRGQKRGRR